MGHDVEEGVGSLKVRKRALKPPACTLWFIHRQLPTGSVRAVFLGLAELSSCAHTAQGQLWAALEFHVYFVGDSVSPPSLWERSGKSDRGHHLSAITEPSAAPVGLGEGVW